MPRPATGEGLPADGGTAWASRPRSVVQSSKPLTCEANSPAPDDSGIAVEPRRDFDVVAPVCREQYEFRALNDPVRQRVARRAPLKRFSFLGGQDDLDGAASHHSPDSASPWADLIGSASWWLRNRRL